MTGRHNLMKRAGGIGGGDGVEGQAGVDLADAFGQPGRRMRGDDSGLCRWVSQYVERFPYNSNPRSLIGMVWTLAEAKETSSRRIVIAGEMLELGRSRHRCIVRLATRFARLRN